MTNSGTEGSGDQGSRMVGMIEMAGLETKGKGNNGKGDLRWYQLWPLLAPDIYTYFQINLTDVRSINFICHQHSLDFPSSSLG